MRKSVGNSAGFFAIVVWSFLAVFVTFCAGVPFFLLIGLASLVTFALFALQWLVSGEKILENLRIAPKVLVVAVIGNGLQRALFWSALLLANPVEASLINDLWPILVVVSGAVVGSVKMELRHFLGLAAAIAGVLVLMSEGGDIFANFGLGHAMAALGALIWGAYVVIARQDERYGGNTAAVAFLLSGVVFLGISAMTEWPWVFEAKDLAFVMLAVLAGSGGRFLWEIGAIHGDERSIGICSLFMPLLAAFWLVVFGRSEVEPSIVIGALLIFGAAVIVSPHVRARNIIKLDRTEQ